VIDFVDLVLLERQSLPLRHIRAFSSEVDTGSREENASKQKARALFRFNRNGKGSSDLRIDIPAWRPNGFGSAPTQSNANKSTSLPSIRKNAAGRPLQVLQVVRMEVHRRHASTAIPAAWRLKQREPTRVA
jgi:hypothetical protein